MALKNAAIVYVDFVAPVGTVVANIILTYTDSKGVHNGVTLAPDAQPVAIDLAPETYNASAQAVDAAGAAIGPAAVTTFVVDAPATVIVQIPGSLSVA